MSNSKEAITLLRDMMRLLQAQIDNLVIKIKSMEELAISQQALLEKHEKDLERIDDRHLIEDNEERRG